MATVSSSGYWDQSPYDVRCEWGPRGLAALAAGSDVIIIVDTISFSTCVDIAVARGGIVYPCCRGDQTAAELAEALGATLVGMEGSPITFSASSMLGVRPGMRLVLPSPNGGALASAAGPPPPEQAIAPAPAEAEEIATPTARRWGRGLFTRRADAAEAPAGAALFGRFAQRLRNASPRSAILPNRAAPDAGGRDSGESRYDGEPALRVPVVLAGCLRNARAVAAAAARVGLRVAVIAAGERWPANGAGDRSLRPAAEDLIAAGAIIEGLPGRRSPEAELAVAAFRAVRGRLPAVLAACSSGREHEAKGTAADVALAAQLNVSDFVPRLVDGGFVAGAGDAA